MGEIVTSDFINLPCVLNINQLENILLETFDVAFTLCNANYAKYGPDKVVDIINQIIPTAVILKTGYWPFYATIIGHSICICERFYIECEHKNNLQHWINMKPIEESSFYFKDDVTTQVKPKQISMDITQKTEDIQEIIIGINFYVSLLNLVTLIERKTPMKTKMKLTLRAITGLFPILDTGITFIPHPAQLPQYGQCIKKLKDQYKYMHFSLSKPLYVTPSILTVDTYSTCKLFTLILQNVRIFKYVDHTKKLIITHDLLSNYNRKSCSKIDEKIDKQSTYYVKAEDLNKNSTIQENYSQNDTKRCENGIKRESKLNQGVKQRPDEEEGTFIKTYEIKNVGKIWENESSSHSNDNHACSYASIVKKN